MANEDSGVGLSPTVSHVIDEFIAALRSDDEIEGDAIDRLETILRQRVVPKSDDINAALFDPILDGEI